MHVAAVSAVPHPRRWRQGRPSGARCVTLHARSHVIDILDGRGPRSAHRARCAPPGSRRRFGTYTVRARRDDATVQTICDIGGDRMTSTRCAPGAPHPGPAVLCDHALAVAVSASIRSVITRPRPSFTEPRGARVNGLPATHPMGHRAGRGPRGRRAAGPCESRHDGSASGASGPVHVMRVGAGWSGAVFHHWKGGARARRGAAAGGRRRRGRIDPPPGR